MPGNLRDRLRRIQKAAPPEKKPVGRSGESVVFPGWVQAGCMTLKREISGGESYFLPKEMPEAAEIVIPGIKGQAYEDLLFFDLETTGLSCGAGTVAFLSAFGRLLPVKSSGKKTAEYKLNITQYLLLDYPGEYDFIGALAGEINAGCTIVSYNGKCFDSQILKTRCLMKGIVPPEYRHTDLLFPARRLWKRILPGCSQGMIETAVLGIDRTGDIPGSMAPEIWFSFLRNGETGPLLGICEHNRRDIAGLASIFAAMAAIAENPAAANEAFSFDFETLALRWNETTLKRKWKLDEREARLREKGLCLLRQAALMGMPGAELRYAVILLRTGEYEQGRAALYKAASPGRPPLVQAAALRALAIDSERRLRNLPEALELSKRGLAALPSGSSWRNEFSGRAERLQKKLEVWSSSNH